MTYPDHFLVLKDTPDYPAGTKFKHVATWQGKRVVGIYHWVEKDDIKLSYDYFADRPDWFKPVYADRFWQPTEENKGWIIDLNLMKVCNRKNHWEGDIGEGIIVRTEQDGHELIAAIEETINTFHRERYFNEAGQHSCSTEKAAS